MELDWLETFLAVVDRGGFAAASEAVHRSQSRVSAHIAALERDLGVLLVDRTHRPARLTAAGEAFAHHARDIVTGVGAARSAVMGLRGIDAKPVTVFTTPCVGAALFPGLLAELVDTHPGARVSLVERGRLDLERRLLGNGPALAVVPRVAEPLPSGLQERVLWWEPFRVVVPVGHELAAAGGPVPLDALATGPLIVCGADAEAPAGAAAEVIGLLVAGGRAAQPRAIVDTPQTLLALVRAGVGFGVLNAVALAPLDLSGLVVLDIDEAAAGREVALYWYEATVRGGAGMELHRAVAAAPPPTGAELLPG